ncbi:MAG: AAA family ATPase [Thomasclavelia sp.]|nr:AAA family ATPase [Thomasclavelia sp.]
MKKLIFINGVMGVGKTTVCKELYHKLNKAVWLDGDWCWMSDPFVVNNETKEMVQDNITHLLNNFLKCQEYEYVIFDWVMDKKEIQDELLSRINQEYEFYNITLIANENSLKERVIKDINDSKRSDDALNNSINRLHTFSNISSLSINTTDKSVKNIVKEIESMIN